jgi:hypothetical protein
MDDIAGQAILCVREPELVTKLWPGESAEIPPMVAVHAQPPLAPGGSRFQSPSDVLRSNAYWKDGGGHVAQDLRMVSLPSFLRVTIRGTQLIGALWARQVLSGTESDGSGTGSRLRIRTSP